MAVHICAGDTNTAQINTSDVVHSIEETSTKSDVSNTVSRTEISEDVEYSEPEEEIKDVIVKPSKPIETPPIVTVPPSTSKPQKEETKPVETPDIITNLNIKLYNKHEEGFNKKDGREYIADIAKYLNKYAPNGMLKSVGCAMAYTEGGSGKQGVYVCSNNCFGIMATSGWNGMVYSRTTGKVYKDYSTAKKYGADGLFRAYNSMEDSVKDYVRLISGDYYCNVLNITDHREYIQYILDKGYGEPHLIDMWMSLIDMYDLKQYD